MNGAIRLDARLSAVMGYVRPGSVVADIGCDHGYLICALAESGLIKHGYACEANLRPLERAKRTITENCLSNRIDTVLTEGLTGLPHELIDTYIIAGMGGDLISNILFNHSWIFNSHFDFILQPMTKPEKLRQAIYKNGFTITSETAAVSRGKVYTVMCVRYTDRILDIDDVSFHTGTLLENSDFSSRLYLEQVVHRLEKKAAGLARSKTPEKAEEYFKIANQIRKRMK